MKLFNAVVALFTLVVVGMPSIVHADTTVRYLYNDGRNTPVAAADDQGQVLWRKHYRPFGVEIDIEGDKAEAVADDRGFTGHIYDRESELTYMGARYYNPRLGVFYGTDPARVDPNDPMTFNPYIYANQSPYANIDPDGRAIVTTAITVGFLAYRLYSAYDTAKTAVETGQMIVDPNVPLQDKLMAGAGAVASAALGKAGGAIAKAASKYAKPAFQRAKNAVTARLKRSAGCQQCKNYCFVAGTLVATANGSTLIESIKVGDRVETTSGTTSGKHGDAWVISATMPNPLAPHEDSILIEQLQWTQDNSVPMAVGALVKMSFEELGLSGTAQITNVRRLEIPPGNGRLVLATFNHLNNDVYELSFVEGGEALRGTGLHPLYSLDRDDWVRIRDLQVGERLQTVEGAVTIEALEKVRGVHRVYNLEVEGDHEYLVGEARVRAHNTCFTDGGLFERTFQTAKGPVDMLAEVVAEGKTLILKDVAIYGRQGTAMSGVLKNVLKGKQELMNLAREAGFEKLVIRGERVAGSSSANPGKAVELILDLTR